MRIDLEDAASGTSFRSDVCIVGAGVMGLLLAEKLARSGLEVSLLEAGGLELEPRSQALYETEMRGETHLGTTEGRFRAFGGSSIRWGGQLLPYSPEVFASRAAVGGASWPVSETDLEKYYPEISSVMGVNDLPYDGRFLRRVRSQGALDTPEVRVRFSKFAPFPRRNLAKTVGHTCLISPRVTVYVHANAVSVDLEPGGNRVQSVTARNYRGAQFTFTAGNFAICTGAIEASRLLLNSTAVVPAGIGNSGDLVGRCFHDHLSAIVAWLNPPDLPAFVRHFAPYYVRGTLHTPKMEAAASLQNDLGLLDIHAHFGIHESENSGFGLLRRALRDFQHGKLSFTDTRLLLQLPMLAGGAAKMAFAMKVLGRRLPSAQSRVSLSFNTEQKPRADSRIQLSERRDALGLRQAVVNWKRSSEEGETIYRYASVVETYLASLGLKQLAWVPQRAEGPAALLQLGGDSYHHMGGTPMGTSPRDSVVTGDLRLHDVTNLYVASCSVLPSGGSTGPTFTVMALTLRLAHHLRAKIQG
jgi:choline dehydrogenase-like flavoprotein